MLLPTASIIGWSALNLKRSFQPSNILTKSLLHTEITTGKSDRWSKGGTKIWKKISVHPGYHALMNQCLFGSTSSFPGWIFCPRKPHPFGNKYHSICCGLSGIMYAVFLGRERMLPLKGKLIERRRRLERLAVFFSDLQRHCYHWQDCYPWQWFFVLQAIIALQEKGVFSGILIFKKVLAQVDWWCTIDKHMTGHTVGECDSFRGKLNGIDYDVFCKKEPEYVMKIISTYGGLIEMDGQHESKRTNTICLTKR